MGCAESTEARDESKVPLKDDDEQRRKKEPPNSAYQNMNLRKDKDTKEKEITDKGFWSDEDWSDSEEEEEKKKMPSKERKQIRNKRLENLERLMYPEPKFTLQNDAINLRTLAVANVESSVRIYEPIYHCKNFLMGQYLKSINEKGGKVLFVPPDKELYEVWHLGIHEKDKLFPVCVDGLVNSQILYLVLKGIKRTLGISGGVNLPHGAISGYDVPDDELESKKFAPYSSSDSASAIFRSGFGQRKAPRFGEKLGKAHHAQTGNMKWKLKPDNAQQMKEYFDLFFYKQPKPDPSDSGKTFFFCFAQAFPIVVKRLLEMNKEENSLANVVIVAIPFGDPTQSGFSKDLNISPAQYATLKSVEQYKLFAQLFTPVLK